MFIHKSIQMFKFQHLVRLLRTWLELGDTLTNALHRSSTLVAQDDGEKPLWVAATQSVGIRVTHPGGKELRGTESFQYQSDSIPETLGFRLLLPI